METKTFRHPVIQLVGPLKGSCIEGTRSQCKILTFRNVGNHSPNDTTSHLRRTNSQDVAFEVYTASVEKKWRCWNSALMLQGAVWDEEPVSISIQRVGIPWERENRLFGFAIFLFLFLSGLQWLFATSPQHDARCSCRWCCLV